VAYRLVPKLVFPDRIEDSLSILVWVFEHASEIGEDRERVAILGASSFGAIATGLCPWLRDKRSPQLSLQIFNFATLDGKSAGLQAEQLIGAPRSLSA
jgi:acetyl esterase/lipase